MVPIELIPPAKLRRFEPEWGSPNNKVNGLAVVCCNENPKAMVKKEIMIKFNEFISSAGIMSMAPATESPIPPIKANLKPTF